MARESKNIKVARYAKRAWKLMSKSIDYRLMDPEHTLVQGWHANHSQQTCSSAHKYIHPIQGSKEPHMPHSKGVCI